MNYYYNFMKGIKSAFFKAKTRGVCFMCNRGLNQEEFENGLQSMQNKLNMMKDTADTQKTKVEKHQLKIEKIKKLKTELSRFDEINILIDQKKKLKDTLEDILVEMTQSQTQKQLLKSQLRENQLRNLQTSVIEYEDLKAKLTEFYNDNKHDCDQIFKIDHDQRPGLTFWDKIQEALKVIQKNSNGMSYRKEIIEEKEERHFVIPKNLKVFMDITLQLKFKISDDSSNHSKKTIQTQIKDELIKSLANCNKKTLISGLTSTHSKLRKELDTYKTKIMNGLSNVDQKEQEIKKILAQIEVLKKEVQSFMTQDEFESILNNHETLNGKTELDLNKMLTKSKKDLTQLKNEHSSEHEKLQIKKNHLNDKLCRVDDYKLRFEKVLNNTKIKDQICVKMRLETLIRNTQKDLGIVQNRMNLASLQEEISILKQESANMIKKISTKTVEIDKIKALESEKTFYKTQMTTLVGKKSLLLEKTRSLMRIISETHYAEKQYLLSLKEHEVIFRCKTFVDKMALEMEKKIHEYHVERIKQINQCVNNIWKHTYESKDIQEVYIELADDNKKLSQKKTSHTD